MVSFETLINSLTEAVILFDKGGRLAFANKAAEEFLGTSLRELKNRRFRDLFKESEDIADLIAKTLKEGRPFNGRELEVKVGRTSVVDLKLSPYYGADSLEGAVLSISKHPEFRAGEDYPFDSMLYMIGSVAHEIKNPLSGIRGAAQILRGIAADAEGQECVDLIIRETDRLNAVLLDYLTMTRKPVMNLVNIHEVLEHAMKVMWPALKERKMTVEKLYDPSLPSVQGDEGKLLQVFINILKNAMEAMASCKRPSRLKVSTGLSYEYMVIYKKTGQQRSQARKQKWVVVNIVDSGTGIPRERLDRIFLPFFTGKASGSGLGLALSKKIIKDHRGLIKVDSEPGKGSTFSVYLPF